MLSELAEELESQRLVAAAELCPLSWSQRLGYLLELVKRPDLSGPLLVYVEAEARCYALLRRAASPNGSPRSSKWKLVLNEEVEPDL